MFRNQLEAAGIMNRIVTEDSPKHFGRRIPYLAGVRNRALEPIRNSPASTNGTFFNKVLFLNDIVFTVRLTPPRSWPGGRRASPTDHARLQPAANAKNRRMRITFFGHAGGGRARAAEHQRRRL